jgi:hypothetical protein
MKNPFPGMNPYLENHWQDVHTRLTMYAADQIQEKLPGDLVARAEEQIAIDEGGKPRALWPDVKVVEPDALREPASAYAVAGTGGNITVAEPLVVLLEPDVHRWIEILDAGGRLITVIEVLSPTNKSDEGHAAYRRRQRSYISGGVNLVEIDLLRKGERVLSLPMSEIPDEHGRLTSFASIAQPNLASERSIPCRCAKNCRQFESRFARVIATPPWSCNHLWTMPSNAADIGSWIITETCNRR